jgi:triphosphoribosyl-dephospho-CoA synthase
MRDTFTPGPFPRTAKLGPEDAAFDIPELAASALITEALLTPKPGLIDRRNNGGYVDRDVDTLLASAAAASEWFPVFFEIGAGAAELPATEMPSLMRPALLQALREMLRATGGIAMHRGATFLLGTLCLSAGRLLAQGVPFHRQALCRETAAICEGIVERELAGRAGVLTNDCRIYQSHGLAGVRGEAQSGFATVRAAALPVWDELRRAGVPEQQTLLQMLLRLIATADDVHVVARGGRAALQHVRAAARCLVDAGGVLATGGMARLVAFDDALVARRLIPGLSADLLRAAWFLAQFPSVAARESSAQSSSDVAG